MSAISPKSQKKQPCVDAINDNCKDGDKDWIQNLEIGDYVDVSIYNDKIIKWEDYQICRVTARNEEGMHLRGVCSPYLWFHSSTWKREIDYKFENEKNVKLDKVNTYTEFHSFLSNPALGECDLYEDYDKDYVGGQRCHKCGKYCCIKCALIVLNATIHFEKYECEQCNEQRRYDSLYTILVDAFDDSANGKALLDEYIISDIVEFSIGFIVQCKNESCDNEICFRNEISMFNGLDADNKKIEVVERERISVKAYGAMTNALFKDNEESDSDSDSEQQLEEEDMMNGDDLWNKCGGVICSQCLRKSAEYESSSHLGRPLFTNDDSESTTSSYAPRGLFVRDSASDFSD